MVLNKSEINKNYKKIQADSQKKSLNSLGIKKLNTKIPNEEKTKGCCS